VIEFLTLFLTLTLGPRSLELAVDEAAAQEAGMIAVELRLDGEPVGTLTGPPWQAEIDFGEHLIPHELEAVALDANGEVLERISQLINYGRSPFEARLLVDRGAGAARVLWQAAERERPRKITVLFDGEPVPVDDGGRITLPPTAFEGLDNPERAHLLEAKLEWKGGHEATAELSYGGAYGVRVTSDLTQLAVSLPPGMEAPEAAAMAGWFEKSGAPLKVFQVEKGPAQVLLVRDRNLPSPLPLEAAEMIETRRLLGMRGGALDNATAPVVGGVLRPEGRIQVIATTPQLVGEGAARTSVFPIADYRQGGDFPRKLLRAAWLLRPGESFRHPQRLYDALAAAGDAVAKTGRRRAVLLLLDPRSKDASAVTAAQALEYLESLRVPVYVWTATKVRRKTAAGALLDAGAAHGTELIPLVEGLGDTLRRQVVVWFEGRHLPQQITLGPAAPAGLEFAR
jgi:hypothetical protein